MLIGRKCRVPRGRLTFCDCSFDGCESGKRKMAVVTLVQGLDEHKAGPSQSRSDLRVSDTGPAHHIDCSPQKMIAVGDTPYCSIVFDGAERAGDDAKRLDDL